MDGLNNRILELNGSQLQHIRDMIEMNSIGNGMSNRGATRRVGTGSRIFGNTGISADINNLLEMQLLRHVAQSEQGHSNINFGLREMRELNVNNGLGSEATTNNFGSNLRRTATNNTLENTAS